MKVRKKLTALLGATVMAAAVMFAAGGTVDAKAAASYKVDCSTGDVSDLRKKIFRRKRWYPLREEISLT